MRLPDPRWSKRRRAGLAALVLGVAGLAAWALRGRPESWPIERAIPGDGRPDSFRPDGRALVLTAGPTVREVDLATGAGRTIPDGEWPVAWQVGRAGRSRLERYNDAPRASSELRVVDAASGAVTRRLVVEPPRYYAQFAPDGGSVLIFLGQQDHAEELRTWDLATGAVASRPLTRPPGIAPRGFRLWRPSPDGRTLAYFDLGRMGFRLWDVATDRARGEVLRAPGSSIPIGPENYDFTPDGRSLVAGLDDGRVAVWDVERAVSDRVVGVLEPGVEVHWLRLAPDGRSLAASGYRRPKGLPALALWYARGHLSPASSWWATRMTAVVEFPSGRRLAQAEGAVDPLFSPDGRRLALREWGRVTIRPAPNPAPAPAGP